MFQTSKRPPLAVSCTMVEGLTKQEGMTELSANSPNSPNFVAALQRGWLSVQS